MLHSRTLLHYTSQKAWLSHAHLETRRGRISAPCLLRTHLNFHLTRRRTTTTTIPTATATAAATPLTSSSRHLQTSLFKSHFSSDANLSIVVSNNDKTKFSWQTLIPEIFNSKIPLDLEHTRKVYRRGRAELFPDLIDVTNVEEGIHLLDLMVQERSVSLVSTSSDETTASWPIVLDDPWLLHAWHKVSLHELEKQTRVYLPIKLMIRKIQQYFEKRIFAWDPRILMLILDVWHAEHKVMEPRGKIAAAEAVTIVEILTLNYSDHRPLDKFVVMRLLHYLADDEWDGAPHQADVIVTELRDLSKQYPNDARYRLDAYIYSAWIHVFGRSNLSDAGIQSLKILRLAQEDGLSDTVLFDTVLHSLCRSRNRESVAQAQALLDEMLSLDLPVRVSSWRPLLKTLMMSEDWRPAAQLWRTINAHPKARVRPDASVKRRLCSTFDRFTRHWNNLGFVDQVAEQVGRVIVRSLDGRDSPTEIGRHPELVRRKGTSRRAQNRERVDWERVATEWECIMKRIREEASLSSVAYAFSFLDCLGLFAFKRQSPWVIPSSDVQEILEKWKHLSKRRNTGSGTRRYNQENDVSFTAVLRRLILYQGIGLLRPSSTTLDFMMDGIAKQSESPMKAAMAAQDLFNMAVEDCQNDPHHPDFINKVPVTRLINILAAAHAPPRVIDDVWTKLQTWYVESGERRNLKPDEEVLTALIRGWSSSTAPPEEITQRVVGLWRGRLQERETTVPSIALLHTVASALAKTGAADEVKTIFNEILRIYTTMKSTVRRDLDFISPLILALCNAGRLSEALQTVEEMEQRFASTKSVFFEPSSECYNILLSTLAEEGDIKEATFLLDRMMARKPTRRRPDEFDPYKVLWGALARSESPDAAMSARFLLENTVELQDHPGTTFVSNSFVYDSALECFSKAPNPQDFVRYGESIVRKMEAKNLATPKTYELLLHLLLQAGLFDKAYDCLHRLCHESYTKISKVTPNRRHFEHVISGLMASDFDNRFDIILDLLREMLGWAELTDWEIKPSRDIYTNMINFCEASRAKPIIAEKILTIMESQWTSGDSSVAPTSDIYYGVISCWSASNCEDARERIEKLAERFPKNGISLEAKCYSKLLEIYEKYRLMEKAQELWEIMTADRKSDATLEHGVASLEFWIQAGDGERAAATSERIIRLIERGEFFTSTVHRLARSAIALLERSRLEWAGRQSEKLLRHLLRLRDKQDIEVEGSTFSLVVMAYLRSKDGQMIEGVDRILELYRETNWDRSLDISLLESALKVHLYSAHMTSHSRICTLIEDIELCADAPNLISVCDGLKRGIIESNIEDKDILLEKLRDTLLKCVLRQSHNNASVAL